MNNDQVKQAARELLVVLPHCPPDVLALLAGLADGRHHVVFAPVSPLAGDAAAAHLARHAELSEVA